VRVLQIGRYGSVKGGAESYVRELCAGLRNAGHEVALAYRFDPDDTRLEVRAGTQIAAITSRNASPAPVEAAEVRRAVEAFAPDVIHVHNAEAAWLAGLCDEIAPVLSAVHDHRLDCPTGTRYWAAWNRACDVTPGATCLGYNVAAHCGSLRANATLEPYLRWKRLHAAARRGPRIQVFSGAMRDALGRVGIEAPVEVTPYPATALPAAPPAEPGDARPVVLAHGRATKEKGFDLLLEAMHAVEMPAHLVIAGDGHHLPALRRAAAAVPPRHRVTFLGWTQRDALAGWLRAATVAAVPSAWPEPFGIAGLEAMSVGVPVVASDIGGIREWLDDGATGLAVPPRDATAFGRAIARLLADATLRERMGAAAKRRIEADFALDAHVARVVEIYERTRRSWKEAA